MSKEGQMLVVASHVLNCWQWLNRPVRQECGQGLIEYRLLAALIALVAIGAVTSVGGQVNSSLWEPMAASF